MGGIIWSSEKLMRFWTQDELSQIESIQKIQDIALKFVTKHIYYGIPIRSGRKSLYDPISMIWIEPLPELIEFQVNSDTGTSVAHDILSGIPTSVAIDSKGRIKIMFTLSSIEYNISEIEVLALDKLLVSSKEHIMRPKPPIWEKSTEDSISMSWSDSLPYPVGIILSVEVQYSIAALPIDQAVDGFELKEERKEDGESEEEEEEESDDISWSALVTKQYSQTNFYNYSWERLFPGRAFRFRLRYRMGTGYSPFSKASIPFSTNRARPPPPEPPSCVSVTPFAIELQWLPPIRDNGSPTVEFVLNGKSVGDVFEEIYRGPNQSFLAVGLYPEFAYSFQVAAVNDFGQSDFSRLVSVQTPVNVQQRRRNASSMQVSDDLYNGFTRAQVEAAELCKDAWLEFWDPKTEQVFYFNSLLSKRQLEIPAVILAARERDQNSPDRGNSDSTSIEKERMKDIEMNKQFRKKRYRLSRSLHKRKNSILQVMDNESNVRSLLIPGAVYSAAAAAASTETSSSPSGRMREGSVSAKKLVTLVPLRRDNLLEDFVENLSKFSKQDIFRRWQIEFANEEGIDSGGLSKEAFLLLSQELRRYGELETHWLRWTQDATTESHGERGERGMTAGAAESESESDTALGGLVFNSIEANSPHDNPNSSFPITMEVYARLLGILTGKAILDRHVLDFPFSVPFIRQILGKYKRFEELSMNNKLSVVDIDNILEEVKLFDADLYRSMRWILDHDITGVIDCHFSVTRADSVIISLCPNGSNIPVTEANKEDYIKMLVVYKLVFEASSLMKPFLAAFYEIVPLEKLVDNHLSEAELSLMLNGKTSIDVEEIRAYCIYQGSNDFNECHDSIVFLWRALREMSEGQRRQWLRFLTGTSRVPLDGYDPPITITEGVDMITNSLPRAHTCFNQLVLPPYSTYEKFKDRILFAIANTQGFALS